MKKIYVFAGFGADYETLLDALETRYSDDADIAVEKIDEAGICALPAFDPRKIVAFFLPGGSKPEYDVRLGAAGFDKIRHYVEQGGAFVGFCAGAYYASRQIEWRMDSHTDRRIKQPGLSFFNGIARGPINRFVTPQDGRSNWYDAQAVNITYHGPGGDLPLKTLYWGGPELLPDDAASCGFTALARFDDLPGQPPCILQGNAGRGLVILSAIHPEVGVARINQFLVGDYTSVQHGRDIARQLTPHETARQAVWHDLMAKVDMHHQTLTPHLPPQQPGQGLSP